MLMQLIDCMIEQDPPLSARRTIDMRRYIVNRWNRTHEEPIDEDGVALFLCDENRGNLTDEQRLFARECREEITACYRNAVFQMFQCGEMMRGIWCPARRNTAGSFCRSTPSPATSNSPRVTACEPLCASISGGAETLPLPAVSGRIWPVVPPLWRRPIRGICHPITDLRRTKGKAGESLGAFMAPGRSLPPAVRAVSGVGVGAVPTNPI